MQMSSMPIAVLMQRRAVQHRWIDSAWSATGVVSNHAGVVQAQMIEDTPQSTTWLIPGSTLSLYLDENDGYFENWIAPEPKVFIMWRVEEGNARPITVSVSYGEGTRMMDSGESADGVMMPPDIHAWLGQYLQEHYKPRQSGRMRREK